MGTITIGNYTVNGKSITIRNGIVTVDGKKLDSKDVKIINIEGEIDVLNIDVCESITVKGNAGEVKTSHGDIKISGDVIDDVKTSQGDIEIGGDVTGNVTNSMGDIKVSGDIYGKPKTSMGDIKGKKIYIER